MRGRRCTIDSSCIVALDHADLVPLLSFLFTSVLVPHGTLWVLQQLYDVRFVSSTQLRKALQSMLDRGVRLPLKAVNSLLARLGE